MIWNRKRKGNEEERKRNGKGNEKEGKRKGKEKERSRGRGREKEERKKERIYLWSGLGLLFEQMGIARGIANLASCMYVALCKTTSDVDIIHTYRYRFWGALSLHSVLCIFQTPEKSPYISTIPEF